MNVNRVYINNVLIDLSQDQAIYTTIKRLDIGDLSKRSISYTNQLKSPWTETNCSAFGFAFNEHSTSFIPYSLLPCRLYQNGIQTITGNAVISRADQQGILFNIFEESYDLFKELDGLTMDTVAPISDSGWGATARDAVRATTSGIIAAILNWGMGIYVQDRFLPSFYYHTLVTSALEYTGLAISGDILTEDIFTDLVVPFPAGEFTASGSVINTAPVYSSKGSIATGTGTSVMPTLPSDIQTNDLLLILTVLQGTGITFDAITDWTVADSGTFNNSTPTAIGNGAVFYRYADGTETTPTVSVSGGTPTQLSAVIYKFRGDGTYLTLESISNKNDGDGNSTITWNSTTVGSTKRTLIALLAQLDSSDPGTPTGYTNKASDTVDSGAVQVALECSTLEDVNIGSSVTATGGSTNGWITFHVSIYNNTPDLIEWNQYLSSINVIDLIKDFFNRFCLVHKVINGTLYLKSLEDIINDKSSALDWSSKLVNRRDESIDFLSEYGQANYFKYVKADDVLQDELGTGSLNILNTTLPASKDIYTTVFQNSRTVTTSSIYTAAFIPVYTGESTSIEDIQNEPGLRLLTLKDRTTETAITFDVTARTDYKLAYFVDATQSKDTGWQYFLDQKYPALLYALQKKKLIKKYFYLNELDIYNYDPFKMIFDGNGYYIINKIPKFIPGKITEVELFRVSPGSSAQGADYSDDFSEDFNI